MRVVTPARLRAVGLLLLEAASLGLLIAHRVSNDDELREAVRNTLQKVRGL